MSKGYCDANDVATYLGVTLTDAQEIAAVEMLGAAEAAIDTYTGRTWLTGAITGEIIRPPAPFVLLPARPVASIQQVRGRVIYDTAPGRVLVAGQEYLLQDANRGRLMLLSWQQWEWVEVDYTPVVTVPEAVRWGTAITLAHFIAPISTGVSSDVEEFSITGQLRVKFRAARDGKPTALPPDAQTLLDTLTSGVVLA